MKKTFVTLMLTALAAICTGLLPTAVNADAALYEAPIPADKSLIRFVNAKLDSDASLDFSGTSFQLGSKALSGYHIIQNGSYEISDGSTQIEADLLPGKFYTIAVGLELPSGEAILVLQDPDVENPSRSALSFYNYTAKPADLALRLNEDTRTLFEGVEPGAMASRELPAVDIGLEVSVEGNSALSEEAVSLAADKRQNVVVLEVSGTPTAFVVQTELVK